MSTALRKIRIAAGLTQQQVADRMGVCRARIPQLEGSERVRPETARRFREAVRDLAAERSKMAEVLLKATSEVDFENLKT